MQCKFCKQYDKPIKMHWVIRKGKSREKEWFHFECFRKEWGKDDNKQEMH